MKIDNNWFLKFGESIEISITQAKYKFKLVLYIKWHNIPAPKANSV